MWTDEMRAKAAATRAETKRKKEEREAKKALKPLSQEEALEILDIPDAIVIVNPVTPAPKINGLPFDWSHAPVQQAIERLGDLKREYDAAAAVVLQRSSLNRPQWTCWTQGHKDLVPASIRALCKKSGDDGRWASRDDGNFREENGIRVPDPVICCNASCHEMYQRSKQAGGLSRH